MSDPGPHSSPKTVPPGTRLNDIYEIDTPVASGGMGEVYRGHTIHTGDIVAIKLMRPEFAENESALGLFRKEGSALHSLHHEAIVRYYVCSVDAALGRPYLAMEFVEGESLADLLSRSGPLSVDAVWTLKQRIAGGLQAAHERGIVHRDVASDNIIIPDGDVARAKIIDFGIARIPMPENQTIIGSGFAGKYNYVSPEQLGLFGGDVTAKSDIYSLGLVLSEALRGKPLDMAGTQFEVVEKRRNVPDLGDIDPRALGLLERMLQPNPIDRPANMAEVATWPMSAPSGKRPAAAAAPARKSEARAAVAPAAKASGRRRPRLAIAASLILLLGLGGGAGWYFLQPGPTFQAPQVPQLHVDSGTRPAPQQPEQARREEEERRQADQRRRQEDERRQAEQRQREEEQRQAERRQREEEQRRQATTQREREEVERRIAEQRRREEEQRRREEEQRRQATTQREREEEERRQAEQRRREEEQRRQQTTQRQREEEERRQAEQRRREEEQRRQQQTTPRDDEERRRQERAAKIARYIMDYEGGDCFFIKAVRIDAGAAAIEGLGASVTPFQGLDEAFKRDIGFEADIGVRQVTQRQCPAVTFLGRVRAAQANAPRLALSQASLTSGQMLTGTIEGRAGHIELLLVSDSGAVYSVSDALKSAAGGGTFSLSLERAALGGAQPQLLLAIASERPLAALKSANGTAADRLFSGLLNEAAAAGQAVSAAASYFKVATR